MIVYDPAAYASDAGTIRELARFSFPRQPGGERLSIADYFRPVDSGVMDVVAFQIVTVGDEATHRFEKLQADGEYARRSTRMGSPWRRRRRSPSGCIAAFVAISASSPGAASDIRGGSAPAPISRITSPFSRSSPPSQRWESC